MNNLLNMSCKPCRTGTPPLDHDQVNQLLKRIPHWQLSTDARSITRSITTSDFMAAVETINHIAIIAEAEHHHPDLQLTNYRLLTLRISTHAIDGLSINDFVLAAKIDAGLSQGDVEPPPVD